MSGASSGFTGRWFVLRYSVNQYAIVTLTVQETMMFQHFDAYVDSKLATTLDQLTKLCRIPSVSAQRQPALANTAARVADLCREAGMYVQVLAESSGSPIILAEARITPNNFSGGVEFPGVGILKDPRIRSLH